MPEISEAEKDAAVQRLITNMVMGAWAKRDPISGPVGPDCVYRVLLGQFEKDVARPAAEDEREFFKRAADYFVKECLPRLPEG